MDKVLDLQGIITVLNTPFTRDNLIDVEALKQNVQRAIDAGVVGFLVPAMASEVSKLSLVERREIIEAVLEIAQGTVIVIGGASALNNEECIKIAKDVIDLGCDGVLINIPYKNDMQYTRSVEKIANLDPGFLMLQDWSFEGYGIPIDLIVSLFDQIEVFKALKVEVVPSGVKYSQVLESTNRKLHVSGGWAVMQMIEALDRGVHAFMPTGMHWIYTEIIKLYKKNRESAKKLFNELLPVLAFSNQHLDISVHFYKRLLFAQGIYNTPIVREPILKFDAVHEKMANEHIEHVKKLETRIINTRKTNQNM